MSARTIAIGDLHGFSAPLETILQAIDPQPCDTIVTLGDYCDRGPDTPGVLSRLLDLAGRCHLVPILGNHDEMLLSLRNGGEEMTNWLGFGGLETLESYGVETPGEMPAEHLRFLEACLPYYETDTHLFVHASYRADLPLSAIPDAVLRWESLRRHLPGPHYSGKTAIAGHTAQRDGKILDLGYLKCIDTYCYGGYWLTALDVGAGQVWQASPEGVLRGGRE